MSKNGGAGQMKAVGHRIVRSGALAATLAFASLLGTAYAQDEPPTQSDTDTPPATAEAPPVDSQTQDSNVWNWQDVPKDQKIEVDRAVFDQGGYQLYCHTGETIVVPFVNNNLYVMRFGRSEDGMYFVTDGKVPTLYIPVGGYLENSAAAGAKWYPFPETYDYTIPVYVGPAPTWDAYLDMAWYPGMGCYGGYYGYYPYHAGVVYAPFPGFYIAIYGHPYYGWSSYHAYYGGHPDNRFFIHTAPVFRYDHFPQRGPQYYAYRPPFGAGHPLSGGHGEHDPRFGGRPSSGGHTWGGRPAVDTGAGVSRPQDRRPGVVTGNPRFGSSDTVRPSTTVNPRFGSAPDASPGAAHVPFGGNSASTPGTRNPFGGRTSTGSATTRVPFGGVTASSASSHVPFGGSSASSSGGHSWSGGSSSGSSSGGHTFFGDRSPHVSGSSSNQSSSGGRSNWGGGGHSSSSSGSSGSGHSSSGGSSSSSGDKGGKK